ncbi:membrane protein [Salmonella enterica subsp. enterica]|nr:membrane protein [Salmonella enterica subsp. enterica]
MDDVFGILPSWMFTAIVAVIVLLIIGIIFARLYRRASAEQAFVRTGLGGQKVVMSGGAIVDANLSRNYSDQYEYPKT